MDTNLADISTLLKPLWEDGRKKTQVWGQKGCTSQ